MNSVALSPNERTALQMLALGYVQADIERELFLSRPEVNRLVKELCGKFGARTPANVVALAIARNMLPKTAALVDDGVIA